MRGSGSDTGVEVGTAAVALGLIALCCGGPLLIAALAATGAGAWLLGQGAGLAAGLALVVAAGLSLAWVRRRRRAPGEPRAADCCTPAETRTQRSTR